MIVPLVVGIAVAGAIVMLFLGVSRALAPATELDERIEEWV